MKKHLLYFFALVLTFTAQAQSLTPTVIASGGAYSSNGGVSLSYTVGELAAVQTFTSANTILTQGFQQPNDIVNGLLDIEKGADGAFSVYPIPAQTTLWFGYEFTEAGKVEVSLVNILGQKMQYSLMESYDTGKLIHSFDCSAYASGNYILSVKFTATSGPEKILSKKIQIIN
jgi:hypothetical protein